MRRRPWLAAAGALLLTGVQACRRTPPPPAQAAPGSEPVTFNAHIAPLVFQNCAPCHRPGEAGPFSLLSYQDVRKRARQVARVTSTRYMPPWPPEPGHGELAGERRLSDEQIALVQRWVAAGAPEGPPAQPPAPPAFTEGWQLGPPDLVVEAPQPYTVPAEGTDVFRNLVLPVPGAGTRFVRALELRPGDKRVVHHANVLLDRTGSARARDARDPGPGFAGMDVELASDRFEPDSHFLFWKPGTAAVVEPEGMAWTLAPGTDLVLNLHLQPSGKPEVLRPVVGLYFTDSAPTRFPMLLQLEHDGALDIPAGRRDFTVTDHYDLPLDVEVLGIYPHAHYVGRDVQAWAALPDGGRRPLLWIRDWDFNWQAVYRYARPVPLPKGSRVHMKWTYDNSEANVRNPSQPPRRVVAGNRSTDEMAHLWLQVLPPRAEDRLVLQETFMRRRLEKYPVDFVGHANLGAALEAQGRTAEAIGHYEQALRARPGSAVMLNNAGAAQQSLGRLDEAVGRYRDALRVDPEYLAARYNLATALMLQGKWSEAAQHLRQVVRVRPDDAPARANLGAALLALGRAAEAARELGLAVEREPASLEAQYNLGRALVALGRTREGLVHLREALRLGPDDADVRRELAEAERRQK